VLKTVAQTGEGIDELVRTLDRHALYLRESGELSRRRQNRLAERVRAVVDRAMKKRAWTDGRGEEILEESLPALETGAESPYTVAARIVRAMGLETQRRTET
jgi:LAO/AO transport system kinase